MSHDSPFRDREPIATARALELLREGTLETLGRMPYSSNATFLMDVEHDGLRAQAIYKPHRGERPLWDFPSGLYQREVAAFLIADDLGWDVVPPTVVRDDAPLDTGSLQLFMPSTFEEHYFTIHEHGDEHDDDFRRICALDIVINNTDRKSGHCLLGKDGRIWAIDHGIAFHQRVQAADGAVGLRRTNRCPTTSRSRCGDSSNGGSPRPSASSSTPSNVTPCSPGPPPWRRPAASRATTPAAIAIPGRWSDHSLWHSSHSEHPKCSTGVEYPVDNAEMGLPFRRNP